MIYCDVCGRTVTPRAPNYRQITGWEQVRKGGGANAITLRKEIGIWAHHGCIDVRKAGLEGQERFVLREPEPTPKPKPGSHDSDVCVCGKQPYARLAPYDLPTCRDCIERAVKERTFE